MCMSRMTESSVKQTTEEDSASATEVPSSSQQASSTADEKSVDAQNSINNNDNFNEQSVEGPALPEAEPSTSPVAQKPPSPVLSSFGLPRLYKYIDISPDKCLISADKLVQSPSKADGMSDDLERELRYLGCELIQAAAILLKLPQVAAATGQILYQRYFYSKSFVRTNFEHVAMACVNLASKIEESPRRPRDVINVFHHLKQLSKCRNRPDRKPHPLVVDKAYTLLKNNVIKAERRVLNVLGFCVHVKHPHKLITAYLRALQCLDDFELIQLAWNYMNDGLRTDIFLRYSPETIACACIFLSARVRQVPLPDEPKPWWELFDATESDIEAIATILLMMYRRKKSPSWSRIDRQMGELQQKFESSQRASAIASALNAIDPSKLEADNDNGRDVRSKSPASHSDSESPDVTRGARDRSRSPRGDRAGGDRDRDRDRSRGGDRANRDKPLPPRNRSPFEPRSRNQNGSGDPKRDRRRRRSSSSPRSPLKQKSNKDINKRLTAKYGNLVTRERDNRPPRRGNSQSDRDHSSRNRRREKASRSPPPPSNRRSPGSRSPPPTKRPKGGAESPPIDREKLRQIRKQREREVVGVMGKRRRPSTSPVDRR